MGWSHIYFKPRPVGLVVSLIVSSVSAFFGLVFVGSPINDGDKAKIAARWCGSFSWCELKIWKQWQETCLLTDPKNGNVGVAKEGSVRPGV